MDEWSPALMQASCIYASDPTPFERLARETSWPPVHRYADLTISEPARAVLGASFDFVAAPPRLRRQRRASAPQVDRYDARIVQEGVVPTRPKTLHDLFNAIVWGAFPRSKRVLHARQHAAVASRDPAALALGHRTAEEDQLALLDEGGVVVACVERVHGPVAELARRGATLSPFIAAGDARPYVFGHALLEHLAKGRGRAARAAVIVVATDGIADRDRVDALLAERVRTLCECDGRAPEAGTLFVPRSA